MPDWGVGRRIGPVERGPAPVNSAGAAVAAGAAVNTKGVWVTMIAATARPAVEVILTFQMASPATEMLVDLGLGPAGSEQVEILNLYVSKGAIAQAVTIRLPLAVASGVRVAVRAQANIAAAPVLVTCHLAGGSGESVTGFEEAEGVGVNAATSRATTIDGGASANTKPPYVQLVASTAKAYRGFFVLVGNGAAARAAGVAFALDVAIGAAGSERILIADLPCQSNAQERVDPYCFGPFWIPVAAGQRLSCAASASTTTAAERTVDVALLAVPA